MAEVHRAFDEVLGREVAIKILHAHLASDPTFLERFRREARAAAALTHPNVVAVHDWGESDGAFLVLQLIEGPSMRDVLRHVTRLAPHQALALIGPTAAGLGAAHAAGLVHRDVKPENVLVGRDGVVRITDFGLARAVASSTSTFGTGVVVGSPHYLAPEAVRGEQLDPRADVYALGIMLFECLTGRVPHHGDSVLATAMAHTTTAVPAPSSLVRGIDPALDELVRWSTDRRREARYDDAAAFAWALDAALPEGPRPLAPALLAEAERDRVEALAVEDRHVPRSTTRAVADLGASRDATLVDHGDTVVSTRRDRWDVGHDATVVVPRVARSHDHDDDDLHGPRRSRRGARVLLVLAALAAAAAVLVAAPSSGLEPPSWLAGLLDGALGATVEAPDQRGEPLDLAVARLESLGLEVVVAADRVNDPGVPAGHVLAQDPIGTTRSGRTVSLVVSAGPRRTTVPTPSSSTVAEVVAELERAGLTAVVVTRASEEVEEGRLIGLDPQPGTAVDEGSRVSVLVSTGPPPVEVPRVVGLSVSEASEALRAVGLELDVAERRYDASPALTVLSQAPDASIEVPRGTTVLVVISDGPAPVTVPNLRGSTVGEALAILEDLGLRAEVVRRGGAAARLQPDRVYDQDPGPGAVLRPGETVIVYAYDA